MPNTDTYKKNILFLLPGMIYRPDLPNISDRYLWLSQYSEGAILADVTIPEYQNYPMGQFMFIGRLRKYRERFSRIRSFLHKIQKGRQLHRKRPIEVIICYDPVATGLAGLILKWLLGCRLIIEINSAEVGGAIIEHYGDTFASRIKDFFTKQLSRCVVSFADAIKTLTSYTKRRIETSYPKKQIYCFPNFVPTHYFKSNISARIDNYILCVGHPFYLKGMDVLIDAYRDIVKDHPQACLVLIGHQLKEYADQHYDQLPENITFLSGVHYDQVKAYFESCYCFVLASRTEGMGRVLLEAMACGKPVIGSNVGGIPDVIQGGRNGFLFESENVDDLADKLDRVLSDPDLARRMGEEGRKIVEEKFSSEQYCLKFKAMLDDVLTR